MENIEEKKKIDYKYNLRKYLEFNKPYVWLIVSVLFVVLFQESISSMNRYLFKFLIDKGSLFSSGELIKESMTTILLIIGGLFILGVLVNAFLSWFRIHLVNVLDSKVIRDVKDFYFSHIVSLDYDFHTKHKTGSLISRIGRGSNAIEKLNDTLIYNIAPVIFQLIISLLALVYFDWVSSIVILITMILFVSYSLFMHRLSEIPTLEMNKASDVEKGKI